MKRILLILALGASVLASCTYSQNYRATRVGDNKVLLISADIETGTTGYKVGDTVSVDVDSKKINDTAVFNKVDCVIIK